MILFWGQKGYQKVLGHTQATIECGHCLTMLILGKLRNMDASSLFIDSTLSLRKNLTVSCPICHYGKG